MKNSRYLGRLGFGVIILGALTALAVCHAAPPQMQSLSLSPEAALSGRSIILTGRAIDPDGDLSSLSFYVSGPGYSGWNFVAGTFVSGGDATGSVEWTPPANGDWSITCQAWDTAGNPNGDSYATIHIGNRSPQNQSLTANPNPITISESVTFTAHGTDPDGNLSTFSFYVNGPENPGWNYVGNIGVSGNDATATYSWTPPAAGNWAVTFQSWDSEGAFDGNSLTNFSVTRPNQAPEGYFDGIQNPHVNYGGIVTGSGWAADPENGATVNRVEIRIDDNYVGTANLGGWRQDVANAYGRSDYGNSAWTFSYSTNGMTSGLHTITARAYDSEGAFTNFSSYQFTVSYRFQILIDVNQMNSTEAASASSFSADGIWAITVNSPGVAANVWTNALINLNANRWAVSEDNPNENPAGHQEIHLVSSYIGRPVDGAMFYFEERPHDDNVLTTSELNSRGAIYGPKIIVSARSYAASDPRRASVNTALANSYCAGVDFEFSPGPEGSIMWNQEFNAGVKYALSLGKKCYLLMPARFISDGGGNYRADVEAAMRYFVQSGELGNPNLYIVLAAYVRDGANVGFLQPDGGSSGNSILAARNWLMAYRNFETP